MKIESIMEEEDEEGYGEGEGTEGEQKAAVHKGGEGKGAREVKVEEGGGLVGEHLC